MGKLKSDQSGFGAIETALILIIVAILGFAGWYVWHHKQAKNTKSSTTAVVTVPTQTKNFEFKEMGVKLNLSKELSGLTYTYYGDVKLAELTTPGFEKVIEKCFGTAGYAPVFATIRKGEGQYQGGDKPNNTLIKQFDNFYIIASEGQIADVTTCTNPGVDTNYKQAEEDKLLKALVESFQSATVIKN